MNISTKRFVLAGALAALSLMIGCGPLGDPNERDGVVSDTTMSFEEFEASVYREPETGIYIVDGDTPIETRDKLREFYEHYMQGDALAVNRVNGQDDRWSDAMKQQLTYCVSTAFGARYDQVVAAMDAAARAWESAACVRLTHVSSWDSQCNASTAVTFDVRPTSAQPYLARAFFPSFTRSNSNILIDQSAFGFIGPWTLTGILRHELGHTIGFRHEHTRPEAGVCFEDNNWRALTAYDAASVMHYPQCNGTNTGDLQITNLDQQGAASLYGDPVTCVVPGGGGSNGDTHLRTFDNLFFDFQASGEFVLATDERSFMVQARQEPWVTNPSATVNTAIAAMVGPTRVGVYLNKSPALHIDGVPTPPPCAQPCSVGLAGGGQLIFSGNTTTMMWPGNQFQVAVSAGATYLNVDVSGNLRGVHGILGEKDGLAHNDFVTREGRVLAVPPSFEDVYGVFAESWRISPSESLFDYDPGEQFDGNLPDDVLVTADLDPGTVAWAQQVCTAAGVIDPGLFEACVIDVAVMGDPAAADKYVGMPIHDVVPIAPRSPCITIQRGVLGNVEDATIDSGTPNDGLAQRNFGNAFSLAMASLASGERFSLVRYDLSPLVRKGATITSAVMTLHVWLSGGSALNVHRALAPWDELSVTYASFNNAFSPQVDAVFPDMSTTSADVTALVQGWVDGTIENHGILLRRVAAGSSVFGSSEHQASLRPSLHICYTH